jgi:hypothetical protein
MANTFRVNVYQIDQFVYPRDAPLNLAFPTTGCIFQDVSGSPTRSLSSGYNVYGLIINPIDNNGVSNPRKYYVAETIAQLVTLAG